MPQKKIKLTRPELKRYRDALARYERYLPTLKLKQQQLQLMVRAVIEQRREAEQARQEMDAVIRRYERLLADWAGVPLEQWAQPAEIRTSQTNVAGVRIPVLEEVIFPPVQYSLFATPPWVDQVLADLRERTRRQVNVDILREQERLIQRELTKIIQRVNLFEKVMIPFAKEAIRRIRIRLGDLMTEAVGRAKMAKKKLSAAYATAPGETDTIQPLAESAEPLEPMDPSSPGIDLLEDSFGQEDRL
ncbi:MAG: V-type ATP synthase subunit D [Thermoguttaceae bacterium]|nr:V-type ATP synthase subunit D [Thermoguttaceae bacterium]MDW8037185.1 V-type ATP synthase subunit D [Thermoguttaceae bacterium]